MVDEEGLHAYHAEPDKVSSITIIPVPVDASGVKSFLGTTYEFWQFTKDYAFICLPLIELTKKRSRFHRTIRMPERI